MSISKQEMLNLLGNIAPEKLSESWDNSGVQIDLDNDKIDNVLVALEVNDDVVKEAIEKKSDMIVVHHPLIFSNMKKVKSSDILGNKIIKLIQNNISVYAMHTSFDSVKGGNNDYILKLMNWKSDGLLVDSDISYYKIIVFVPEDNLEAIKASLVKNGAGAIGDYEACTFYSEGTGTFTPKEEANPHIGEIDKHEKVSEYKLESIIEKGNLYKAVAEMIKAHPYEEPAYDIIKLENKINKEGLGRIVKLDTPETTLDILIKLKKALNIDEVIKYTAQGQEVKKIAICTGSGADLIKVAKSKGCDLLITGDIKYHDAHMAKDLGIDLIDLEHFHSEKIFVDNLMKQLEDNLGNRVNIEESKVNLNPFMKR